MEDYFCSTKKKHTLIPLYWQTKIHKLIAIVNILIPYKFTISVVKNVEIHLDSVKKDTSHNSF